MTIEEYILKRGLETELLQEEQTKDGTCYLVLFKDDKHGDYFSICKANKDGKLYAIYPYLRESEGREWFKEIVCGELSPTEVNTIFN